MRAQTRDDTACCDLEDAAERVALSPRFVDQIDHSLLCFVVRAMQWRVVIDRGELIPAQLERRVGNAAKLDYMTAHLDAEHCQQLFRERATCNTRRRFASGSTFQDVAQIAYVILQTASQIGVTGARPFQSPRLLRFDFARLGGHNVCPVGPVFIFNQQGERRAERETVPDAGQYLGVIALDLHAATATITELATSQLVV